MVVEKLPYFRSFEVFVRRSGSLNLPTSSEGAGRTWRTSSLLDIEPPLPLDPSPQKEISTKVLSLEGNKLKFGTWPRLAHEHCENHAQKEDLIAEPENCPPHPAI